MAKKLLTRSQFAALAGVSGAAITKAAKSALKPAVDGRFIDANHDAAIEYIKKNVPEPDPVAPGIDPYYEDALKICVEAGKCNANMLCKSLKIGRVRASKIVTMIKASGILSADTRTDKIMGNVGRREVQISDKQKIPHVRGTAARKARLKLEADDEIDEIPENIQAFADMTLREVIARYGTDVRFADWLKAVKEIEMIHEKRLKNAQTTGDLVSRDLIRQGIIEPLNTAHIKMSTDGAKTIAKRVPAMHAAGEDAATIERYVSSLILSFIKPVAAKVERTLKNA